MHRDSTRTPDPITVFTRALASYEDARRLIDALREEEVRGSDDPVVMQARVILQGLRDGTNAGEEVQGLMRGTRDELVAALYTQVPELTISDLAVDAGFKSTSFVTRLAAKFGAPLRVIRSPRRSGHPGAAG